ncbi:polysaccharide biosynthesis protein [Salinarchaeum sp. Harcht-Bsk1]|uniref:flippase n=1 Tax=Salinarchaeum sp. Harcht-Bsk1 TaxID=1333523 RepID=UPI0003423F71|nr:flippase [Salinarchaeum sp. Harcht-Bsk1]AGN00939.1 polysaccharide biosynthesis protein [Salinarchaeum sp. Harcht-Bsk1]
MNEKQPTDDLNDVDENRIPGEAPASADTTKSSLTKDQAVRDVVKGAGVVYGGLVAQMALAFLAQRFAAVHLSISGFGGLTTGTALLNLGGIVAGLGLSSGLTRYLPRVEEEEKRPIVTYLFALTIPIGVGLAAVTVLYADFIAAEMFGDAGVAVSIQVFGAAIPFAAIMNLAIGGIRGQKISRFRVYVRNLLHPASRFALIIVAVFVGADQAGFAFAYAIPFVVGAAIASVLFERTLPEASDWDGGRERLSEIIRYSLPFTVSGLASFVYRSIDIFLLLYFVGSTAVGIYGVAYAMAQMMGMFSTAFNYLGTPVSSELESENRLDEAITVQRGVARWLAIASTTALIPMVLFADDLIRIIYRSGYSEGGLALAILAVGFALKNVLLTHGPLLEALGLSKLSAVNTTSAALVNFGLNLWLIPRYSFTGAAIATTISLFVLGLLPVIEIAYYSGSTAIGWNVIAPVVLAIPIGIIAFIVSSQIPATILWITIFGVGFAGCYGAAIIGILGFTPTEVMILHSIQDKYVSDNTIINKILQRFI